MGFDYRALRDYGVGPVQDRHRANRDTHDLNQADLMAKAQEYSIKQADAPLRKAERDTGIAKAEHATEVYGEMERDRGILEATEQWAVHTQAGDEKGAQAAIQSMAKASPKVAELLKQTPKEQYPDVVKMLRDAAVQDMKMNRQLVMTGAKGTEERKTVDRKAEHQANLQQTRIDATTEVADKDRQSREDIAALSTGTNHALHDMEEYDPESAKEIRELLLRSEAAKNSAASRGGKSHAQLEEEKRKLSSNLTKKHIAHTVSQQSGMPGMVWSDDDIEDENFYKTVPGMGKVQGRIDKLIDADKSQEEITEHVRSRYIMASQEAGMVEMPTTSAGTPVAHLDSNGTPVYMPAHKLVDLVRKGGLETADGDKIDTVEDAMKWYRKVLVTQGQLKNESDWSW